MKLFVFAVKAWMHRDSLNHPELFWMFISNDGKGLLELMRRHKLTVQADGIFVGLWSEAK